jgi:hypothetical protein
MKLVNDWAKEPIAFLGHVFQEGERGRVVQLNKGELATLRKALAILEQLRLAQDPHGNGDYTDGTPVSEAITWAECALYELLDEHPNGIFRVDLLDCGHRRNE